MTRTLKAGAIWYRTEYEPLGNEIEFPEPQNAFSDGLKGAEEPQWQCEVAAATGHSFFGAPRHCQIAQLENTRFESFYNKQNSPSGITHEGGAAPRSPDSASDELLSLTLTATSKIKPKKKTKPTLKTVPKGTPRPPVDEEDFEKPIQFGDNTVDGFVEASAAGEDYINIPIPEDFKDHIRKRLAQGDCNAWIAKLIAKASENELKYKDKMPYIVKASTPKTPYAKDGYELVNKVNNYVAVFTGELISGEIASGTIKGSILKNSAVVLIKGGGIVIPPYGKTVESATQDVLNTYVNKAIHELIHHAGENFTDQELAYAVSELGETKVKVSTKYDLDVKKQEYWSNVWNDALFKHCGN